MLLLLREVLLLTKLLELGLPAQLLLALLLLQRSLLLPPSLAAAWIQACPLALFPA